MTSKYVSGVLIIALVVTLPPPARADNLKTLGEDIVIAIVAVAATVGVVATVLVIHYSKKRAITGCVNSGTDGMTLTDEKDSRIYSLSGDTTGIKPGDRMKLKGTKVKPKGPDKTLVWVTKEVGKDFGACRP